MIRLSILVVYLSLISLAGLTFGPFESLSFQVYNTFSSIGTNPSFTPVTVDMSMMTSLEKGNHFALPLRLVVQQEKEEWIAIEADELDLYLLKLPLILLMEQAEEGVDLQEARHAICHQLKKQMKSQPISFAVSRGNDDLRDFLFQKEFSCEAAILR